MRGTSNGEAGYTLVLVLVVGALLSLISLSLIQSGRHQSRLQDSLVNDRRAREAIRFGESQVKYRLRQRLEDTGYIQGPRRFSWNLEPDLELRATVRSLNGKINLNALADPGPAGVYQQLVGRVLTRLGYPRRALGELVGWIEPQPELSPEEPSQYGGYGYRSPGRELRHLDELALVSGFRQRGIHPLLRRYATVHGSGKINVYQVDAALLPLVRRAAVERTRTDLPARVLDSPEQFRQFVTRDDRWSTLAKRFPFLSRTDDTFSVTYRVRRGGFSLSVRGIYRVDQGDSFLRTVTRHETYQPGTNGAVERAPQRMFGLDRRNSVGPIARPVHGRWGP